MTENFFIPHTSEMIKNESFFSILKRGQIWKYQKSSQKRIITGWKTLLFDSIASLYNHKDKNYSKKLPYVWDIIK